MANSFTPLFLEIPFKNPLAYFLNFRDSQNIVFLDSSLQNHQNSRYSYLAVDPVYVIEAKNKTITVNGESFIGSPFNHLSKILTDFQLNRIADLPPFQTGFAGYFGYELYQHLEDFPVITKDEFEFPDMILGAYDLVLAFDLIQQQAWIISSGYPELDPEKRLNKAQARMNEINQKISTQIEPTDSLPIPEIELANVISNFSRKNYVAKVKLAIDYIFNGDIFQTNLSQRFSTTVNQAVAIPLYLKFREINPAPFSAFVNFGDTVIASGSPERFMKLEQGLVETRPIKGTRPRGENEIKDTQLKNELLNSEKDRAENIMIVDLLRNDLSRVCLPNTINATELCQLESFATVHHLVSTITGELSPQCNAFDLLAATFPGGSITGAPKIRAMEIIAETEKVHRGPYCGNAGFVSFTGDMDTNILIRTFAIQNGNLTFHAGGGIVADSEPENEYNETMHKAKALVDVLGINPDDIVN